MRTNKTKEQRERGETRTWIIMCILAVPAPNVHFLIIWKINQNNYAFILRT